MARHRESLGSNPALLSPIGPGAIVLSQGRLGQQLGKLGRSWRRGQTERQAREGSPDRSEQKGRIRKSGQKLKISGIQVPP